MRHGYQDKRGGIGRGTFVEENLKVESCSTASLRHSLEYVYWVKAVSSARQGRRRRTKRCGPHQKANLLELVRDRVTAEQS